MTLERKKPMARDTPGARRFAAQRSELRRTKGTPTRTQATSTGTTPRPPRPVASRRTTPPDPVTPAVRLAVAERSGDQCEVGIHRRCTGHSEHLHHRKLRRHGDHRPQNLLAVCTFCHDAIHGPLLALGVSYENGWLLHGWDDPEKILPKGLASDP